VAERLRQLVGVAKRLPLPPGTYSVGAGIAIIGVTSYVFQIIAYRQLAGEGSTEQYSALFGLWVLVFVLTPGFFQPLEQEVGRAVSQRRAQGAGAAPLIKRAATLGAILAVLIAVGCGIAAVPINGRLFHHNTWLFVALVCGIASYCAAYLGRGTLSGNGRFGAYGMMLGSEGVIRVGAAVVLVIVGFESPAPFAFAIVLPAGLALLISLRGQHGLLVPGPQARYAELSTALGWLLCGSVLTQALSYSAYLSAIVLQTPSQSDAVGEFAAGILVARIPILAFGAVQAALLPRLAGLAGAGDAEGFRLALRRLLGIVVLVGIIGVVLSFTVGHAAGQLLFGSQFTPSNRDLGLLAIGSAAYIVATALAQALLALRSYSWAAMSWLTGCVVLVVVVALGNDLFLRSELGFSVGATAAALVMFACLSVRMRSGLPRDDEVGFGEGEAIEPYIVPE
jgi:O-antigen/teichoic acid export membrane protein